MARQPIVGSDNNAWGTILDQYLSVSLNSDGTLNPAAVTATGAITNPMTSKNDLMSMDNTGHLIRVPGSTTVGNVLSVSSGGLTWVPQGPLTSLGGPSPSQQTVFQLPDGSILVIPLSTYSLSGDDAHWINFAFGLLPTYNVNSNVSPGVIKLSSGSNYNIATQINVPYASWFDLNHAILVAASTMTNTNVVYMHGGAPAYSEFVPAGGIYDGLIVGSSAGTGVWGLHYGDGSDYYIRNVRVSNFNAGGGGAVREANVNGWTEKVFAQFHTYDSTVGFQIDSLLNQNKPSHEYNTWNVHCSINKTQTGIVVAGQPLFSGCRLYTVGNCFTGGGTSGSNPPAYLDLSDTTNGPITISDTEIVLQVETTNSGTYNWMTIKTGGTGKFNRCHGMIRFAFTNGNWVISDVTSGNFSFRGMVYEFGQTGGLLAQQTAPPGN